MCGLVGMVGFLEHKHKAVLRDLLFLNTLRGKDSTGLSVVDRDRKVLTRKMTVPGYEFIEHPIVDRSLRHADQIWMGHGRFRTVGQVNRNNAHPFEVLDEDGNILLVGAQNGTLSNKYEIDNKLKGEKFDTDSEALFNWLVEAKDTKTAISILRGAWSLTWWDPTMNQFYFLRNAERPMTFAYTKDKKVLIYASEAWMIVNAARRNGVDLLQNDKGLSCYSTLPDYLYTLDIPQERNVELPEVRREGGYVGAPAKTFPKDEYKNRWNDWWGHDDPNDEEAKEPSKKTEEKGKTNSKAETNVVTLGYPKDGSIRGFDGASIPFKDFEKIRERGCAWCAGDIEDNLIFAFLNEDNLVCVRCMRDTHDKGGSLRRGDGEADDWDGLDDDLPFDLADKEEDNHPDQKNSDEYESLIAAACRSSVG